VKLGMGKVSLIYLHFVPDTQILPDFLIGGPNRKGDPIP
jgi:hypothetical protein